MTKITTGMRNFLESVKDRRVYRSVGIRRRTGPRYRFIGGEAKARKAALMGLITLPHIPDLGRPAYAELTDAGLAALEENGK